MSAKFICRILYLMVAIEKIKATEGKIKKHMSRLKTGKTMSLLYWGVGKTLQRKSGSSHRLAGHRVPKMPSTPQKHRGTHLCIAFLVSLDVTGLHKIRGSGTIRR